MSVSVYEYLGIPVVSNQTIEPVTSGDCPFMKDRCAKLLRKNKPICSVRTTTTNKTWIVCEHRLCATKKSLPLTAHQRDFLFEIANFVWPDIGNPSNIGVKREVQIPVTDSSDYKADYIMRNFSPDYRKRGPSQVVLEMQGGGETTNTGELTKHITEWESFTYRTNKDLAKPVAKTNTLITNAWRRQQEQFIVKGNIAVQTGGGIVFCVGELLYDYLSERFIGHHLNDLREHNWTLAIIGIVDRIDENGKVKFEIDTKRTLFTSYTSFLQVLTNQGSPHPEMFDGDFEFLGYNHG